MAFRGLMARGHGSVALFESRLYQLLDSDRSSTAMAAASSFGVLVGDDVKAVSAESAAVYVTLWQQVLLRAALMTFHARVLRAGGNCRHLNHSHHPQRYFNSTLAALLHLRSTRPCTCFFLDELQSNSLFPIQQLPHRITSSRPPPPPSFPSSGNGALLVAVAALCSSAPGPVRLWLVPH
jgi:hypothetical protein